MYHVIIIIIIISIIIIIIIIMTPAKCNQTRDKFPHGHQGLRSSLRLGGGRWKACTVQTIFSNLAEGVSLQLFPCLRKSLSIDVDRDVV